MSRRWWLLCSLVLWYVFSCSNGAQMPVPYHVGYLAQPTDVQAVLDDHGRVQVSWNIDSIAHVKHFVVGFTDSTGAERTRPVLNPHAVSYTDSTLVIPPHSVYLVRVWAVDDRDFFGPPSMPDSLIVP